MSKKTKDASSTDSVKRKYNSIISFDFRRGVIAQIVKVVLIILVILLAINISTKHGDIQIAASIIRDINILLISTNATLIGLYVTAFIFLNDSLKTRVKEDPTLSEAVAKILHRYRLDMLLISLATGFTIFLELASNIWLSGEGREDVENWSITLSDVRWKFFVAVSILAITVMIWIIQCSKEITHSDNLIANYSKLNLDKHEKAILKHFKIVSKAYEIYKNKQKSNKDRIDEKKKNGEPLTNFEELYNDKKWDMPISDILNDADEVLEKYSPEFKEFQDVRDIKNDKEINEINEAGKSYLTAYFGLKSNQYSLPSKKGEDSDEEPKKSKKNKDKEKEEYEDIIREMEIIFGKRVRLIENIITKICENNIDKSIMSDEFKYDSMCSGFQWLYSRKTNQKDDDASADKKSNEFKRPDMSIDIRDEKRFLDYIKYQIITDPVFLTYRLYDNSEVEELFDKVACRFSNPIATTSKEESTKTHYKQKREFIKRYKNEMYGIIHEFFIGYRNVVGYRDALVHFKKYSRSDKSFLAKIERNAVKRNMGVINEYTELLVRILIDRFTSFVKINNLNLGNTTFDKGWFNYSEMSDSNFTHSSFHFTRIENAIVRNSDLSTCNLINADLSGTDFTDSNFSYSNLTGADLNSTLLDNAQMNEVLFRDRLIDKYDGLTTLFNNLTKKEKENAKYSHDDFEKWFSSNDGCDKGPALNQNIGQYVRDNLYTLEVCENDTDVCLACCSNLMEEIPLIISEAARKHQNYKLPEKYYDLLRVARKAEAKKWRGKSKDEQKDQPNSKYTRENLYGKIRFGVAKLNSASGCNVKLKNVDFSYVDMDDASLVDSDISNAEMYYTYARNAMFRRSNLNELDAFKSDFKSANFSEANLMNSLFLNCDMRETNFSRAILLHAVLASSINHINGDFSTTPNDLEIMYIKRFTKKMKSDNADNVIAMFEEAENNTDVLKTVEECAAFEIKRKDKFITASCSDGVFEDVLANDISIISMNMIRTNFTRATMKDAIIYNNLMRWCEFVDTVLTNALAVGTSFTHSTFNMANMSRAKFYACEFTNVNFAQANMISSNIAKSLFSHCTFGGASGANLSCAEISNSTFYKCNFADVNLSGATFKNCIFYDYDLTDAIELKSAKFINCIFKKGPNENPKVNNAGLIDLREGRGNDPVLLRIERHIDAPDRYTSLAYAKLTEK